MAVRIHKICFWWSIFPLNYQNAYDHQTFQGGDILRGAFTHKYAWHLNGVILWGHMTNKIHISTSRCIDIKLGKVLTCVQDSQTWHFDQVTNVRLRDRLKKLYIHFYKVFLANKLDRLLALGKIFSTEMLKLPPTSCYIYYTTFTKNN